MALVNSFGRPVNVISWRLALFASQQRIVNKYLQNVTLLHGLSTSEYM